MKERKKSLCKVHIPKRSEYENMYQDLYEKHIFKTHLKNVFLYGFKGVYEIMCANVRFPWATV